MLLLPHHHRLGRGPRPKVLWVGIQGRRRPQRNQQAVGGWARRLDEAKKSGRLITAFGLFTPDFHWPPPTECRNIICIPRWRTVRSKDTLYILLTFESPCSQSADRVFFHSYLCFFKVITRNKTPRKSLYLYSRASTPPPSVSQDLKHVVLTSSLLNWYFKKQSECTLIAQNLISFLSYV